VVVSGDVLGDVSDMLSDVSDVLGESDILR